MTDVDVVMKEMDEKVIGRPIEYKEYNIKTCLGYVILKHPVEKTEEPKPIEQEEKTE